MKLLAACNCVAEVACLAQISRFTIAIIPPLYSVTSGHYRAVSAAETTTTTRGVIP